MYKELTSHERKIIKVLRKNATLESVKGHAIFYADKCYDSGVDIKEAHSALKKLYGKENLTVLGSPSTIKIIQE